MTWRRNDSPTPMLFVPRERTRRLIGRVAFKRVARTYKCLSTDSVVENRFSEDESIRIADLIIARKNTWGAADALRRLRLGASLLSVY